MIDSSLRRLPEGRDGTRKWREQLRELVRDLMVLSHADFDVLRQIKTMEAMNRQITTINDKPFELYQKEKCNDYSH